MNKLEFSRFETDTISMLLNGDDKVISILRKQFKIAQVGLREYSGVGYFLYFKLAEGSPQLSFPDVIPSFCFGDVGATLILRDLEMNVGFLLWVKNGFIDFLETYTYGNDSWPESFQDYSLYYFGDKRTISTIRKEWIRK